MTMNSGPRTELGMEDIRLHNLTLTTMSSSQFGRRAPVGSRGFRHCRRKRIAQLRGRERLGHYRYVDLMALFHGLAEAGYQHDRNSRMPGLDMGQQVEAGHAGHPDIRQHALDLL